MDVEDLDVDLTPTIQKYGEQATDKNFRSYVTKVLGGHKLLDDPQTKAWFVGRERDWNYAFRVVWVPGNLHFSGDLDEVTFTHYHAMPTWVQAVDWVDRSDFDYLMEKSTAERKFVQLKSAMELARIAEEHLIQMDDVGLWEKIYEYLDGFMAEENMFDSSEQKVEDPNDREWAIKILCKEAFHDFTPETVYEILGCPDFSGVYEYNAQAVWQYNGMRRWATLVKETEEYKRASETAKNG